MPLSDLSLGGSDESVFRLCAAVTVFTSCGAADVSVQGHPLGLSLQTIAAYAETTG